MQIVCSFSLLARLVLWLFVIALCAGVALVGQDESGSANPLVTACGFGYVAGEEVC